VGFPDRWTRNVKTSNDMKLFPLILCAAAGAGLILSVTAGKTDTPSQADLRHVVAFKFKETATPEEIKKVEEAFRNLKTKISQIVSYEWGTNNSPENLNKGCTHGFILTFHSEEDRDIYLEHPDHKSFGNLVGPLLADVFVIDFWAQK
jgi:hypothetical protein